MIQLSTTHWRCTTIILAEVERTFSKRIPGATFCKMVVTHSQPVHHGYIYAVVSKCIGDKPGLIRTGLRKLEALHSWIYHDSLASNIQ